VASTNTKSKRMAGLLPEAPKLELRRTDQIAALPLGGRIRVDPWNSGTTLNRAEPVAIQSPREKMPFELTPVFLYLTRQDTR
jgi:hypothetical protein